MNRRTYAVAIMAFIVVVSAIPGCTSPGRNDSLPASEYVALQETIYSSGDLIEGGCPYSGMAQPPVQFDYRGPVNPWSNKIKVNDSLRILYGIIHVNDTAIELTNALSVIGIYDFPYLSESGPVINGVNANGTILMSYRNESIPLGTGKIWNSPIIDNMFIIVNVTTYSWVDDRTGNDVDLTFSNRTIVYKNITVFSCFAARTEHIPGSSSNYATYPDTSTHVPSGASIVDPAYSYILQLNVTYKIENLGMYDKSAIKIAGP
jgi:hypothetical protein